MYTFIENGSWTIGQSYFTMLHLKVQGRHASTLVKTWKYTCGSLIWSGRMRYTGNSLPTENVYWSFIFVSPPATTVLGSHSRYFFKKVIHTLSQILDAGGEFGPFYLAKNRFQLSLAYKIPWHLLCTMAFKLEIPLTNNMVDRFRDWSLPM